MSRLKTICAITGLAVLMSGCNESISPPPGNAFPRPQDPAQISRGNALFAANCAGCHGDAAQGDPRWRSRNQDGTFPPPPLNGTGHAWHHSHDWLHGVISRGTEPQGHMPAWGGKLSDAQIDDIIAWFQSLWPEEVYQAWAEMEQDNRTTQLQPRT